MKLLKLALLVTLCSLTVACSATKQEAATTAASTEWRIKSLEESFLNFREEQRMQADKNAEHADAMEQKLTVLEEQIASLKAGGTIVGAPDESAAVGEPPMGKEWVTDLKPEDDGWVDPDATSGDMKAPMAESDEEKPWDKVPGPPPVIPEPTVVQRDTKTEAPMVKQTKPKKSMVAADKAMYDKGLAKYRAEDFEASRAAFNTFLQKYPKSDLVPNALYWKGETYYSEKDYAQSILAFKEVTGKYPKHSKAAAALLKIGMSYDKVGDPDNAIFYLRALVEDFPKSNPAKLGRKELSRLGG